MQPTQSMIEKKQMSAFVVSPAKAPHRGAHISSQQRSFVPAQRRSLTITALENSKPDKSNFTLVPAPQAGAAIIKP